MRKFVFIILIYLPLIADQFPAEFSSQSLPDFPFETIEIAERKALFTSKPFFPPNIIQIDPVHKARFNRLLYGYVEENDRYKMVFRLYFPSRFLSSSGNDYLTLAKRILAYSLYFYILGSKYLGKTSQWSKDGIVDIWLCEGGDAGGEQVGRNIYFYQIEKDREEVELIREVAHEWGHHIIPPIGPYEEPEEWANGCIGERLLLKLLLDNLPSSLSFLREKLGVYLKERNEEILRYYRQAGDSQELLRDKGKRGFLYIWGYILDINEKRGEGYLREVFAKFRGGSGDELARLLDVKSSIP
ncbi:hypothetical protein H5T88_06870 [bacterium]|nr:hypothetical protein [bacterium]